MARKLRILFEGATYHVMSKGNLNDYIFSESKDKGYFLSQLGEGTLRFGITVYAYCIMNNHYHLLIQTREKNLPQFMHFLLTSYASYLSREGRKGHIFAGRYKAILVDAEEYLLTVSRYIHLNPVEAALVKKPSEYKWSSYSYYLEKCRTPAWIHVDWLLDYYGPGLANALREYRQFVELDMEEGFDYPNEKLIAQAILGNEEFVRRATEKNDACNCRDISYRNAFLNEFMLEDIYQTICDKYEIANLKIPAFEGKEPYKNARMVFVYLARKYALSSNCEIAERIGDIGRTGVSECYRRVLRIISENGQKGKELEHEIAKVISRLRERALVVKST